MAIINPFAPISPPGLPPVLTPLRPVVSNVNQSLSAPLADEMSRLNPTSFRGISFPVTSVKSKNTHNLIKFLYPDQDNARIRNTGFLPREWTYVIPLINTLGPVKGDGWKRGTLYPTGSGQQSVWDQLQIALLDKTAGVLYHPDQFQVKVKVRDWDYDYVGDKVRQGVIVTVNFIECLDDDIEIVPNFVPSMPQTAVQIDNLILANKGFQPPGLNLIACFSQLASYAAQILAYPQQYLNKINAVVFNGASTILGASNVAIQLLIKDNPITYINSEINRLNFSINNLIDQGQSDFNSAQQILDATHTMSQFNITAFNKQQNDTGILIPTSTIVFNKTTTANVLIAYNHCFNTGNQSATQFLGKAIHFTRATHAYYKSLNTVITAPLEAQLSNMITSLILQQRVLQTNTLISTKYPIISMILPLSMSFLQVAKFTNNSIDTILSLNPNITSLNIIPANTLVKYQTASGF